MSQNTHAQDDTKKKKRGRKPGSSLRSKAGKPGLESSLFDRQGKGRVNVEADEPGSQEHLSNGPQMTISELLREVIKQEKSEVTRIAQAVGVSENTIYRWLNGSSRPRSNHIKRLFEVLPDHVAHLTSIVANQYPELQESDQGSLGEIHKDLYERIVDLIAANDNAGTRLWQVAHAIFDYALLQLDARMQGLCITLAQFMPPHQDGIHSLRECVMRGHTPWPHSTEHYLYLGNTTLAGGAVKMQRTMVLGMDTVSRHVAEMSEYEVSACSVPLSRGGSYCAGVLTISSTQADFFKNPLHIAATEAYAKLIGLAMPDHEFYPVGQIKLRTMPGFRHQYQRIQREYSNRVLVHCRTHDCSRVDAEAHVQREMEREFEEEVPSNENRK
jgi:transcriptional regulator with XRE-family HTH domain